MLDTGTGDRGVRRDHGVEFVREHQAGNRGYPGIVQIGCNFERDGHVTSVLSGERRLFRFQRSQQFFQVFLLLEVAQTRGVRRGDVDGDVIGMGVYRLHRRAVIVYGPFDGGVPVLSDVDADRAGSSLLREVGDEFLHADIVESHAVDQRAMARQTKHARPGVSGLRSRRDGAELEMAETEVGQRPDVPGVFIQTGGETHGVGKTQPHDGDRKRRQAAGIQGAHDRTRAGQAIKKAEQGKRQVMTGFGGQPKEQGAQQSVQGAGGHIGAGIITQACAIQETAAHEAGPAQRDMPPMSFLGT